MAIYRIFPIKDATLYSEVPAANTGRDEILELAGYEDITGTHQISRGVLQFSSQELLNVKDSLIQGENFSASLHYYLAEASEVPTDLTIQVLPLFQEWNEGKGKFGDIPEDNSGVSWTYTSANNTLPWTTAFYPTGVTGSFIPGQAGGGTWYYEFSGSSVVNEQIINYKDPLDLNLDVTNVITLITSGSINNYGFLLKIQNDITLQQQLSTRLKYFSSDTNTIYPPYLELGWDDSTYQTGSLSTISGDSFKINLTGNKEKYLQEEIVKFRLQSRPTYPQRIFTTSSIYLQNYALPENTTWGIKDEYTDEMVVNFNQNFTKVSCDSVGPYFILYMNTFQPERYYRVLLKTYINSSEIIIDTANTFKVIGNV